MSVFQSAKLAASADGVTPATKAFFETVLLAQLSAGYFANGTDDEPVLFPNHTRRGWGFGVGGSTAVDTYFEREAAGVLAGRNSADSAYAIIRGATPAGANDLATKGYSDTTFAPTSHTHTEADITDLGTYSSVGHTHTAADIAQGTFADARIAQSNVTQHQAALSLTESQISDLQAYLLNITGEVISDLSNVTLTALADGEVLLSASGNWINQTLAEAGIAPTSHTHVEADITDLGTYSSVGHTHTEADITDLGTYSSVGHTHTTADIAQGTFTDARIAQSNVTQHQAALSLTESQISDLQAYLLNITGEPIGDLSNVTLTALADGEVLLSASGNWINQTLAEAGIAPTSHTHVEADITDLGTYQTQDFLLDDIAALVDPNADRIMFWDDSDGKVDWLIPGSGISITNKTITASAGAPAINDITDVTIASPADNEVLAYDGISDWINQTPAEAGLAVVGHTHTTADIAQGTFVDARIAQSNVTQHEAALSILEAQISDLGTYQAQDFLLDDIAALADPGADRIMFWDESAGLIDWLIPGSGISITDKTITASASAPAINDITDIVISTPGDNEVLAFDNGSGNWVNQTPAEAGLSAAGHTHVEADITDLGTYSSVGHTHTTADIAQGTFVDARIAQSNVTQHEAALSLTESQISDLQAYLLNVTGEPIGDLSNVTLTALADGEVLLSSSGNWINQTLAEAGIAPTSHTHVEADITDLGTYSSVGHTHTAADIAQGTFADARIAQSNVTQHQATLSLTESQISDLQSYLLNITGEAIGSLSNVTLTGLADGEVLLSSSGNWINQTLAEAGIAPVSHTHLEADITDLGTYSSVGHTHTAADIAQGTFVDARIAQSNVTQHEAAIDHDALSNFLADEHVAHAGVTFTAGAGLAGGGTIAASRTFDVDINATTDLPAPSRADEILISDASNSDAIRKADVASVVDLVSRGVQIAVLDFTADAAIADGVFYLHIDQRLAGMNLVDVHALVITPGTTNTLDIQIHNLTAAADILSTKLTVDSGEDGSDTAATAAVINTAEDDVALNDVYRIDIDAVHTTPSKGLILTLGFETP